MAATLGGGTSPIRRTFRTIARCIIRSGMGLRATSTVLLSLPSNMLDPERCLILVGNRRIRVLFMDSMRFLVLPKVGFTRRGMEIEIATRGKNDGGPYPVIDAWDSGGRWFEEPIRDVDPLPCCPTGWNHEGIARAALSHLESWSAESIVVNSSETYAESIRERLRELAACTIGDFALRELLREPWMSVLTRLAATATLGGVETRVSHGDLQPGNILVDKKSRRPILTDWETSARRSTWYDRLVLGLGTRRGGHLLARFQRFLAGAPLYGDAFQSRAANQDRKGVLATFLLEELAWLSEESTAGPFLSPPSGVIEYVRELKRAGPRLERLFR